MKFLISSKYLHSKIAEAIGKESEALSLSGNTIMLSGKGGTTEITVHLLEGQDDSIEFYSAYWRDVVMYLKTIPEQPITVDLDYSRVEIYAISIFQIKDSD